MMKGVVCARGGAPYQASGLEESFLQVAELWKTKSQQVKGQRDQNVPGRGNSMCKNLKVKERGTFKRFRFHLAEV